ncbi:dTDP-4-amino-4,6-dideoxygalactose transaminase [Desulfopila sp. IMCC35008]|uniref:dTDP-4-amino-4,6-dideoxygalactose transaminase n=1 Tax=Desulfopila sp. IMCC35008 TaxID=2653858 RepID=UPI0013D43287|nr:dTDP-4-amino-4,6-dideoxygalactose transaminase [Desulfopila sp. IMCC35008]
MSYKTPFNKPYMCGKELYYIAEAHFNGKLAGDGPYTSLCHNFLESLSGCKKSLLTHSCTAALEMSAMLFDVQPGDEVIMPSYTFVSTANAFVLRGATPVFVDVREDTLNIDEKLIERAITKNTKVIVPVHYAGVSCEMDSIMSLASLEKLKVVEDAAQGIQASYKGQSLGSIGDLGALSFHETKNVISGEGGALLINDEELCLRAEIIREKGTDRSRFFRGEVDKYTWQEVGSSFLPGELIAAFLWAQFEELNTITQKRIRIWERYYSNLKDLEDNGQIRLPIIPEGCDHNAHMFYVVLDGSLDRDRILTEFKNNGIVSVFHYVPLHSSPAGLKYGRVAGGMEKTDSVSARLLRLPLWVDLSNDEQDRVIDTLKQSLQKQ